MSISPFPPPASWYPLLHAAGRNTEGKTACGWSPRTGQPVGVTEGQSEAVEGHAEGQ